ncbi:alpha-L-fucosidase [Anaerophaga thermohalophila]|uniref:alpha-L-fucosidase n=1 Tax=Anaerophaga thermohalophila TaxID=177400 RepID=UPI000474A502|nr:alpha-L-fucosidase [Anaerophaga thermohalophila]
MQKYTMLIAHIILLSVALVSTMCSDAKKEKQEPEQINEEVGLPVDHLQQWNADKLSLFVHFGVYSVLGGEWEGKKAERAENIWAETGMFADEYEQTARDLTPKNWDPAKLINLARDLGIKNIIFTVKHHDGFCLFKTETTPFNIVDFTTFDHDLMEEIADACNNANIGIGINFSLTDWHLPAASPMSSHYGAPVTEAHHQNNLDQIRELLTNYGDISAIYFYSGINTPAQSRELRELIKSLQPQCLISNGIGNNMGDFIASPFNHAPVIIPDIPWIQRSSALRPSLGYKKNKTTVDTLGIARSKIRELVKVISEGGNYALNLAPKGDGSLDELEKEILNHMGRWIKVNRDAIFRTQKNPLGDTSNSWLATWKDDHLYLFIDSVPSSQKIVFSAPGNEIEKVRFLGSGIEPAFFSRGQKHEITWTSPAMADPMQLPVLEVTMKDTIQPIAGEPLYTALNDTISLHLNNATPFRSISGMDRLSEIPSNTALRWNLGIKQKPSALLKFTSFEVGKTIKIKTESSEMVETLKGNRSNLIRSENDTIQTGQIFRSKPFYGALKDLHVNPNGNNRLQISHGSWMVNSGHKDNLKPLPLTHHYYYVEIDSENPQKHLYRITGNDGIQVWLNKEEVLLAGNDNMEKPMTCEVVLNLKKGENILLIKNFNRWGNEDHFSLTPMPQARWLIQSVEIPENPGFIEVTEQNKENVHADIYMPNFSIELMSEN